MTAASVLADDPDPPDYVVEQFLIKGAITAFSAKIKAGKTTFIGHLLHASIHGHTVIGMDARPSHFLYCTEEGRKSFKAFLQRTQLGDESTLDVLFLGSVPRALPWSDVVNYILAYALTVNADAVIFDTLTRWAHIKPDQENDAGAAAVVMEPLETLRAANLAVMGVFHERKSGGGVNDAARGSSAFGGAADILLSLTNPETNGHPNRRQLESLGRFDDPGLWIIDLVDGAYVLQDADDAGHVERNWARQQIDLYLGGSDGWMTRDALRQAIGSGTSETTFRRALDEMVASQLVVRDGTGRRGSPFTYRLHPFVAKGAN